MAAAAEKEILSPHLLCSCSVMSGECEATDESDQLTVLMAFPFFIFFNAEEAVEVGRRCEPLSEIACN